MLTRKYPTMARCAELAESPNYKDRFVAEYWQTKIRYEKLHDMLIKNEAGKLDFTLTTPADYLEQQLNIMGSYLHCLEIRALLEDVDLTLENANGCSCEACSEVCSEGVSE